MILHHIHNNILEYSSPNQKTKNFLRQKPFIEYRRSFFLGISTNKHKTNYQIIAITTGLILFCGTIAGSTPMVFADHSEDLKDKLAKLKELIAKWKAKNWIDFRWDYENGLPPTTVNEFLNKKHLFPKPKEIYVNTKSEYPKVLDAKF